jgi:hypothetical protein
LIAVIRVLLTAWCATDIRILFPAFGQLGLDVTVDHENENIKVSANIENSIGTSSFHKVFRLDFPGLT